MQRKSDEALSLENLQEWTRRVSEAHEKGMAELAEFRKSLKQEADERKNIQEEQRNALKEQRNALKEEADERRKSLKQEADERRKSLKQEADERRKYAAERKEYERSIRQDIKEHNKRIKELDELFTGQWGKLMESLVKGDLIRLLNDRNIHVTELARETETLFDGKEFEFDIIAVDGDTLVVVEVKTTLRLRDINHFIKKLEIFKEIFPRYASLNVIGAMAWLKANEGGKQRVIKEGLLAIRATGNSASIVNAEGFKPKIF